MTRFIYSWRHFFCRHDDPVIDTLIKKPRQKFEGLDMELRHKTQARRNRAEEIRANAIRVETGDSKKDSRLRVVEKFQQRKEESS